MLRTSFRLLYLALFFVVHLGQANAVNVTATYVKTLGQSNSEGTGSLQTAGGRIAVDEQGNAYFGTPGGLSFLQKVSPDGNILWQTFPVVPGFQGTAVDDKYLYTCGSGYYNRIQLQRWLRDTGAAAPGWQYDWENSAKPLNGVQPPMLPVALTVDDKYLYVADNPGHEIRRFDKASGAEAPFKNRLLVVTPNDLAFTAKGTLLVLSQTAVIEVDKEGVPIKVPVVAGLSGPTAIDVNRKTGELYIAEGGNDDELINRIRIYSADGKLQNEIGIGGDFNGKWHPLSFSFSGGAGDITSDPTGGLWVNGYGSRVELLPLLTHLTAQPQSAPDRILRGAMGAGITVDPDLDLTIGGSYKIGWDNRLLWTSGLVGAGPVRLFHTTLSSWMTTAVWSDGKATIVAAIHANQFHRISAKNGASLGKSLASNTSFIMGTCTVGRDIFYTGKGRTIQRTTTDLDAPQDFMTLPETASPSAGLIAVSPDQQMVYLSNGGETACYRRDGTQVWKEKCILGALHRGVLFTTNSDGGGIAARDAATGKLLALFADKEEGGRPPVNAFGSMAVGSRGGAEYLFIHVNARVLVYKLEIV